MHTRHTHTGRMASNTHAHMKHTHTSSMTRNTHAHTTNTGSMARNIHMTQDGNIAHDILKTHKNHQR